MGESRDETRLLQGEFLRCRNELWRRLRELEPDDERTEPIMLELMALTHLTRQKVLEGLGWA